MQRHKYAVVAIVHRIFTEGKRKKGGADRIINYISSKNKSVLLIEHPLRGLKESESQGWNEAIISVVTNGEICEIERISLTKSLGSLSWIIEVLFNIFYVLKNVEGKPVLFSADPLNALTGVLCPFKFRKRYFHLIDYAEKRFDNKILNFVYKAVLSTSLRSSDVVGVVSKRIYERVSSFRGSCSLIYIPNSPVFKKIDVSRKEKCSLICTGGAIIDKYNYEFIVEIMKGLKKHFKNIKLYALGGIEQDPLYVGKIKSLVKKYNLSSNVVFTGFLERRDVEKLLCRSEIGLSFYSKSASYYTYFGDSLKIREYALYGIPTVADGNSATDKEMEEEGAGFIVDNSKSAVDKIEKFLTNRKFYMEHQNNCIIWANKTDGNKIMKKFYDAVMKP